MARPGGTTSTIEATTISSGTDGTRRRGGATIRASSSMRPRRPSSPTELLDYRRPTRNIKKVWHSEMPNVARPYHALAENAFESLFEFGTQKSELRRIPLRQRIFWETTG